MAIVVPLLMYVSGAAATIGAAIGISATMVSTAVGLALQVTGINNKINKAASKVFGEDLVNIVNIAGAVYGAVSSMGSAAGGVEGVATAGESLSKAALDGTTAFGANSIGGAFDLAGAAGGAGEALSLAGEPLSKAALDGTNAFGTNSIGDSFNLSEMAQAAPDVAKGTNLLNETQPPGMDPKAAMDPAVSTTAQTGAAAPITAAVTPNAPITNASDLRAAAKVAGTAAVDSAAKGVATVKPVSFFDKLLSNDKALGAVVQSVGGAISSSAASKSQKDALDFAKRKYHSVSGVRVA